MLVVADSKIPMAREAFAEFGDVATPETPEISAVAARPADILLVRSETPVGRELLEGSKVRFVGSATIGTDHVDMDWLRRAGVGFSAAPASNADSVKEYVIAALLKLAVDGGFELAGKTLGVVGAGNIGGRVAAAARALGLKPLLNDPPLARAIGGSGFLPLDELMAADFVTLHVPLQRGRDNTFHLFDRARISRLKPGAVLINTSRGPVVDNLALKESLRAGRLGGAVLDVWEGEPEIDAELAAMVDVGTSHIAGYSLDGKVRGTLMLYQAACRHFKRSPRWDGLRELPPPEITEIVLDRAAPRPDAGGVEEVLHGIVRSCYDIAADHARLRGIFSSPAGRRSALFRQLRQSYPVRREFSATRVTGSESWTALAERLAGIGFAKG